MTKDQRSLELFPSRHEPLWRRLDLRWPDQGRFPLNHQDRKVAEIVDKDLSTASHPLIITGYAALDRVVELVVACDAASCIRVLFGQEPYPTRRDSYEISGHAFPKEVQAYWLKRGISILLSAKIIRCIELLRTGKLEARYLGTSRCRLHAKIYCTESTATVGSSNFTRPGMESQLEANVRFTSQKDFARYRELNSIAENYWAAGINYSEQLALLLDQLLRIVGWQEALARACAELLEGEWAEAYLRGIYLPDEGTLWPSQRQGIAQALYVLTRRGSVLVADATGSGKTRMGVHLIGAVADHNLRSGRLRQGKSLMVCPPIVMQNWQDESTRAGIHMDIHSHGILSRAGGRKHELTLETLRRAQILSVDEGHNFLNIGSTRTQNLLRNMADVVMVFTATPLNRSARDLLRIADLLGADNLEPETLETFRKLLGTRAVRRSLSAEEATTLRQEIRRFTVRRTKPLLSRLITREPDKYLDRSGRQCRFPRHVPKVYSLNESPEDQRLAEEIRELAGKLLAVTHFRRPIEMPDVLRQRGVSEEQYLTGRLSSAQKIAKYLVMKSLRSSRAALAEHIAGTSKAALEFGVAGFRKRSTTGNMLGTLQRIAGNPPKNRLAVPLPNWLTDPQAHTAACRMDEGIYEHIYRLLLSMSEGRELRKAAILRRLIDTHPLVLAFDSLPISLAKITSIIMEQDQTISVIVATGEPSPDRDSALEVFALGSDRKRVIGLCSDSLSEGVNFQQAAALVHLDMPSVVRIAEQRVGRIDRLDSPHPSIEVWWPDDAPAFRLSSDERFIERYEVVEALLGSNMPLPDEMRDSKEAPVNVRDVIDEYECEIEKGTWDGIQDAFQPVRELIDGPKALVTEKTYDYYRSVSARIVCRVSLVESQSPWAFFCLVGGEFGAPRWVFMPETGEQIQTELEAVSDSLRQRLNTGTKSLKYNDAAALYLQKCIAKLDAVERTLLSPRKQRALEEMICALVDMRKKAAERHEQSCLEQLNALLDALERPEPQAQPDWDEVASRWLDLIRPIWYERLKKPRQRPLLLKEIRSDVLSAGEQFRARVLESFESIPLLQSPDERVAACILGISNS